MIFDQQYWYSPHAIRDRCRRVFDLALAGSLPEWTCDLRAMPDVLDVVLTVTARDYPEGEIPFHSRWRHLPTISWPFADPLTQLRAAFDLVVVSVLLDAGAGPRWQFRDPESGQVWRRSEGLALASWQCFQAGLFSADPDDPLRVDAEALQHLSLDALAVGFQVTEANPLLGLEGRWGLLRQLGTVLASHHLFQHQGSRARAGHLADFLLTQAVAGQLSAVAVLQAVLAGLGPIWPGRLHLDGHNLGDVWVYPGLVDNGDPGWVPFHKLSQWLTYSLLEPLQAYGLTITDLSALTGLAEYRNGGLFVDGGVLQPRDPQVFEHTHTVGSPLIVSWRALTITLLDELALLMRQRLNQDADTLPLVKVLQGGTWTAGRELAQQRRPGGPPPLLIDSDGTVF
ncbi:MAG: URC4/urg3 family protein [Synechococcales cyanobacterium]